MSGSPGKGECMSIQSDEKVRSLLSDLTRVSDLIDREAYVEAREAALKLRAACVAHGLRSAHVEWNLAIACDYAGDYELAFEAIREAVRLDPVAGPMWNSFRIIVEHMRRAVSDPKDDDEEKVGRLYELLVHANEATTPCHLAYARHLHAIGRLQESLRVLEALTTLNPANAEAWELLATVRRESGDEDGARRAQAEGAVVGDGLAIPFAVSARARA